MDRPLGDDGGVGPGDRSREGQDQHGDHGERHSGGKRIIGGVPFVSEAGTPGWYAPRTDSASDG